MTSDPVPRSKPAEPDMDVIRGALAALLSLADGMEVVAELDRGDQILAAGLRTRRM